MKELIVSKNRECFCNSKKKFKMCCGLGIDSKVEDSYKIYFIIKDIYQKTLPFLKQKYDISKFVDEFKVFYNVKENDPNLELSFKFIDFLLFRGKDKEENKNLAQIVLDSGILDSKERDFLKELVENSNFGIFNVLSLDKDTFEVEIENIFTKENFSFHNKVIFSTLQIDALLYARVFEVFSRYGVLPTFMMKKPDAYNMNDLDKSIESFEKRFENLKEDNSNLTFSKFIDSIEYEIFGGDNPYETYEFDERFEEFKKNNPGKDFDDFLDEVEGEILDL